MMFPRLTAWSIGSLVIALAIAATGAVVWSGMLQNRPPQPSECPEPDPGSRISLDEAMNITARQYQDPDNWFFRLSRTVKFCESNRSWWSTTDGVEWHRVPTDRIPEAVKSYAGNSVVDLVFYVIESHHGTGIPFLDDNWIDAIGSEHVAKVRIAS